MPKSICMIAFFFTIPIQHHQSDERIDVQVDVENDQSQ